MHVVEPTEEKRPAGQSKQVSAPIGLLEKLPALHETHIDVAPWDCWLLYVPGAQSEHAVCSVYDVYWPTGHGAHV